MQTKLIQKSIQISAPAEKVWEVLLTDKPYRVWAAEFSPGSFFETDWKVGSKVVFSDTSNYGLIGKIVKNIPNKLISMEFIGELVDGKEDYESENVLQGVANMREAYTLDFDNGQTNLSIESLIGEQWFEEMSGYWDKALLKIKELAETE